ncbi:histidine phosphatase family protein [Mumia sp.]|uniref:histidine phosphatase family protein n=1 Tax=Mumia sp. TaxID=1965300 RepID=UPI002633EBE2|nr:histidine phosphatase family protein [Mumia sp.]MDD9349263.1 histidine phosphatase family protein [Mumia sp.]
MSRRIIVWRHGQTDWNVAGRLQGQTDTPLNAAGRAQAAEMAARLAVLGPVRIVSSDLQRASATAAALGRIVDLPVETDERLREVAFGEREGMTRHEIARRYPEAEGRFRRGEEIVSPGGETHAEAAVRFSRALEEIVQAMGEDETVVVVAHGAVIRVGICAFIGLPEEYWRSFGGFSNGCWAVLQEGFARWQVTEWNAGNLPVPEMSDDAAHTEDRGPLRQGDPDFGPTGATR